ncbi:MULTISPECIES: caspase family protein [unclassified Coleofasciculus]|uniref:caspase family protein n=1 Tax=unclassified Coleofasciculus TaxID=2692782 RepID=UPI00187E6DCD|nr:MULTISPECIES: caspase family protein [unclassified Coleofasciculus]MBE9125643.1 caspase family protein [Coleofasciculus sp. LEGE 07081]MBE9148797.1 caspase family protein [Coleofasciculus sp. LEGE 07092]
MSKIKRRHFLQFAGSALASIGLSQLDIIRQGDRYAKVLAQSTPRKLALLVGVNNYPSPIPSLQGCLTDVELQYELLVRRFGFNPNDILKVTDETQIKPTRQGIIEAFENHLIKQAKPGDVVVFHYSGHGSRVIDPNPLDPDSLNGTIVPYNRQIESGSDTNKVRDIMGRTLFLWMQALQTEDVTVVLDSCHSGGGLRGNYLLRAVPVRQGGGEDEASQAEFDYQQQWLSTLNLSPEEFQEMRKRGVAKGVAIGSAHRNQLATDAPFDDFHAGAFTYLLTRYLWQQPSSLPLSSVFVNLARTTKDVAESSGIVQEPLYEIKPGSNRDQEPIYFLETSAPAAEAAVRSVNGNNIEFWLGGVSAQSLEAFKEGAIFTLINDNGQPQGQVEQTSRSGLIGYGTIRPGTRAIVQDGTLLREQVRGVPLNIKLRVGVDSSLGNDAQAASTALQSISRVEVVPMNQQSVVDYLFGRMSEDYLTLAQQQGLTNLPPVGSLGLFTAGLTPVPDSFGNVGESVTEAVKRVPSRLKVLLAGRILRLVLNSDTSDLNVTMNVKPVGSRGLPISTGSRAAEQAGIVPKTVSKTTLTPGTEIKVEVQNNEQEDIYIGVLVIGSNGDIAVLYPVNWDAPEEAARVAAGKTLTVPPSSDNPENDFHLIVQGPSGFMELLVVASKQSLRDALKGLQQIAGSRGTRSGDPLPLEADEPVKVIDDLLGDLDRNTRDARSTIALTRGVRAVDTKQLAALSTIIEVVE